MRMPVEDYLNSLDSSSDEFKFIKRAFYEFGEFFHFLSQKYLPAAQQLNFQIDSSDKIIANVVNTRVTISRGIIDFAVKALPKDHVDGIFPPYVANEETFHEKLGGLLFICAHEFFHFNRGHAQIWASHHEFRPALEYDADCFAVAALFRYFQSKRPLETDRIEIKFAVLKCIFFIIRNIIGPGEIKTGFATTHPRMHHRLMYCTYKLYGIDRPSANFGITEVLNNEVDILIQRLLKIEQDYLHSIGIENLEDSLFLRNFLKEYSENNDEYSLDIVKKWEIIEPVVISVSKLAADIAASGKEIVFVTTDGIMIFQKGWLYSKKKALGKFSPVFHNRCGATKPQDYRSTQIIPKQYWIPHYFDIHQILTSKANDELNQSPTRK